MTDRWFAAEPLPDAGYTGLAVGTHPDAVALLGEHGFRPLSVAELAGQRLVLGGYHQISWTGSRTTDLLLVEDEALWLAHGDPDGDLFSPDCADLFAGFHADGQEIPLDSDAFTDAIRIPARNFEIPVEALADDPVARFLFGDHTEDYQRWLADLSIRHLPFMLPPVSLARHYPHPFMRPVIMRCTDNWSGLITVNADLHTAYGYRAAAPVAGGPLTAPETFPSAALVPFRDLFGLEPRDYTLAEFVAAAAQSGRGGAVGTALRVLRGGSDLPASHATWAPAPTGTGTGTGPALEGVASHG